MSNFDNKTTRSVADIVANIMSEKLHPNQQKIDVVDDEKIDAKDFAKLRAMKKEETEQVEEGMSHQAKTTMKHIPNPSPALKKAAKDIKPGVAGYRDRVDMLKAGGVKEETEQLKEYESKNGSYTHKGTYGYAGKGAEHGDTDYAKENELAKAADKPKKPNRGKYGARQNFKRSTRVNESFTEMIETFKVGGLKGLEESMKTWKKSKDVKEEVDNETFTKEVEDQKAKFDGKKKGADVAKASVQAVQQEETHTTVEVLDFNGVNGIQMSTIELDERELTAAETAKKEDTVKSMKKNLQGFKDRYGDKAKSVMYATATKQAKGE
jgi:hypothetical protein